MRQLMILAGLTLAALPWTFVFEQLLAQATEQFIDGTIQRLNVQIPIADDLVVEIDTPSGHHQTLKFYNSETQGESLAVIGANGGANEPSIASFQYTFGPNSRCDGPQWLVDICWMAKEANQAFVTMISVTATQTDQSMAVAYENEAALAKRGGGVYHKNSESFVLLNHLEEEHLFSCMRLEDASKDTICSTWHHEQFGISIRMFIRVPKSTIRISDFENILSLSDRVFAEIAQ